MAHVTSALMEKMELVGANVFALRVDAELTRQQLAEKVNIPASTIKKIEDGDVNIILANLVGVIQALGWPGSEFHQEFAAMELDGKLPLSTVIAKNIRYYRFRLGISQASLGRSAQSYDTTIAKLELDRGISARMPTFDGIARALGVTIGDLISTNNWDAKCAALNIDVEYKNAADRPRGETCPAV